MTLAVSLSKCYRVGKGAVGLFASHRITFVPDLGLVSWGLFGYPVRRRSQSSWSSTSCCHHPGAGPSELSTPSGPTQPHWGQSGLPALGLNTYGPSSRAESNPNLGGYEPNPAATRPHCGLGLVSWLVGWS